MMRNSRNLASKKLKIWRHCLFCRTPLFLVAKCEQRHFVLRSVISRHFDTKSVIVHRGKALPDQSDQLRHEVRHLGFWKFSIFVADIRWMDQPTWGNYSSHHYSYICHLLLALTGPFNWENSNFPPPKCDWSGSHLWVGLTWLCHLVIGWFWMVIKCSVRQVGGNVPSHVEWLFDDSGSEHSVEVVERWKFVFHVTWWFWLFALDHNMRSCDKLISVPNWVEKLIWQNFIPPKLSHMN